LFPERQRIMAHQFLNIGDGRVKYRSHDSLVGIALGYGLDDRGSRVRFAEGTGKFFFTIASRTALGPTQLPIQWVPGALSLGLKRPGREADHWPHLVPRSKNEWGYTSTPQYVFMAWCLVKHRDKFIFYLYYCYCFPSSQQLLFSWRCLYISQCCNVWTVSRTHCIQYFVKWTTVNCLRRDFYVSSNGSDIKGLKLDWSLCSAKWDSSEWVQTCHGTFPLCTQFEYHLTISSPRSAFGR
jgi:hypothetical protein